MAASRTIGAKGKWETALCCALDGVGGLEVWCRFQTAQLVVVSFTAETGVTDG